jgi:hypothetical protein
MITLICRFCLARLNCPASSIRDDQHIEYASVTLHQGWKLILREYSNPEYAEMEFVCPDCCKRAL